ncbi:dipeptide ABC transporter ATP-binding protein [soil metagenome]
MSDILLQVQNLQLGLYTQQGLTSIVDGVNFTIRRGEVFTLLGESGSGKTLTALAVMQLLPQNVCFMQPSRILFKNQDLLALPEVAMCKIRGHRIAMIFQEPMSSLNPVLTIGTQISEVLRLHLNMHGHKAKHRVIELLESVGIENAAQRYHEYPHQWSGGMKQRAMIAMALAAEPDLLIADEPTSALDVTIQAQILELLRQLQQRLQMAVLFITHDLGVAKAITDQVAIMYSGHIVEQANKAEFFTQPLHPYSQKLFASLPNINKRHQPLAVIPGRVPPLTEKLTACRFANRCDYAWDDCRIHPPACTQINPLQWVRCHLYDSAYNQNRAKPSRESALATVQTGVAKPASSPLLEVHDLKVYFPIQKGIFKRTVAWIKAVDGINLHLEKGRTLALVGESGSGKTTVGKSILQLQVPSAGSVRLNDIELTRMNKKDLQQLRRQAQIIFQDPFSSMDPRMLVGDIIAEGMVALNIRKSKAARDARIDELITQVNLPIDSKYRYPHEFSGGQRQRISIARALAVDPSFIICDEPTSALDVSVQAQILNLLRDLQQNLGLAYLFITHNLAVVSYLADDIAVIHRGKIVEHGPVDVVLNAPQHPYTQELLAAVLTVE